MKINSSNKKVIGLTFTIFLICQILDYFVRIHYSREPNSRFIFGLLGTNMLAAVVSALLLGLIYLITFNNAAAILPLSFVTAGTLSNITERIFNKGVTDYIAIAAFPSFNLADALITVGLAWIAFLQFSHPGSKPKD
jgi:lipoprotein signal peptidase